MAREILLFVYGTLKRGQRAHLRFCAGARFVCDAWVPGRLHLHPDGYPVLAVPDDAVLAVGSPDVRADAGVHEVVDSRDEGGAASSERGWREIRGEVLAFALPSNAIAAIDEYEGVGAPALGAPYRRVLLRLGDATARHAWAYAAASPLAIAALPALDADAWP